jgi:oligosaccharide repeat unit polymerase
MRASMGRRRHRRVPALKLKMQTAPNLVQHFNQRSGERTFIPGIALMALTAIVALVGVFAANDAFESYPYLFLVPWIFALAIVMAIPSVILIYQKKFSFADPIVFGTWAYFFPAFVVGGLFFSTGWSQPYYLAYVQDVPYNLPLTIGLVALGFAGLSLGYFLPIGARIGAWIEHYLPQANFKPSKYVGPGIVLLALGILNTILAFILGVFGYQKADQISSYDGLIYFTTLFWMEASFLLWYLIFRKTQNILVNGVLIVLLIATAVSRALFAGNRGSAIQIFIVISLAYILSGRELKFRQTLISGMILTILVIAGMIYGTTFRNIKGGESQQSFDQYSENVGRTLDQIGKDNSVETLQYGLQSLTERLDGLTTLSVVVSNYEQLAPYEEAYELDNNIWKDMTIYLVPRIIWKEKPPATDARKYSDLYFNQSDTSFVITPMGDLLRNFGVIGIPIGMLFIGLFLRIFYRALIEEQPRSIWRSTLYFMLLTSVAYEGFYGTIIPTFFKVGFIAVVGLLIVAGLAKTNILPQRMEIPR